MFQGGTPWVTQILNNVIVSYCFDGTLLCTKTFEVKKTQNLLSPLGKAGPLTLEPHIYVKALKMQGFLNN